MWGGYGGEDALQGLDATEVKEKKAPEIMCANVFCGLVSDL